MKNGPYELVVAPNDYPGKRYRGRYCYEHHLVWWQNRNSLPRPGEVIHHENDDKRDNRIENLSLKTNERHSKEHTKQRGRTMVRFLCPSCNKEFVRQKHSTHLIKGGKLTFCSRQCTGGFGFPGASKEKIEAAMLTNVVEVFKDVPIPRKHNGYAAHC